MRTRPPRRIEKRGGRTAEDALGTRERILRVAERLFAERGYKSVSLRTLTTEAGANIASVNYHFGSKEGLVAAIFDSRCGPMISDRRRRLEACAEGPGRPPLLEQVVEAFVAPAVAVTADASGGGTTFTRLRAVLAHENHALARRLIEKHFDDTSRAFIAALHRCLPHLSLADVYWRFHFLLGALYYTTVNPDRIRQLSGGLCDPSDPDTAIATMVRFVAAGFRAPAGDTPSRT